MEKRYLRPDVQIEPLIDKWYAWPHLIPPATAARNLTERHLRIMQSYISAPQVHANAVRNPKMLGGPFIDYGGKRVPEIQELMKTTAASRSCLLNLSAALAELDQMLETQANGQSLSTFYGKVPALLRGYVELVYDLNNHASYRIIEPLMYRSPLYARDAQSVMMSVTSGDDRPFILSTPRLRSASNLELKTGFDDPGLDRLFSSAHTADSVEELAEQLAVPSEQIELFRSCFTGVPPRVYERYQGSGARWRYFGHACILFESPEVTILFDPVLSYTYESKISRFTYEDVPPRIDYVVITHNHQDHVLLETLLQLRHRTGCIVVPRGTGSLQDPSLRLALEAIGFRNVIELDEFQRVEITDGFLMALPFLGEHCDLNIRAKLAYLLRIRNNGLLFAADSCNIEPMLYYHLHKEIGDIRTIFLGMECDGAPMSWLYGPLLTKRLDRAQDESRRLNGSNCQQGLAIVDALKCSEVFVYAMGQEPWLNHVMSIKYTAESNPIVQSNQLLETCRSRGLLAERLFGERELFLD